MEKAILITQARFNERLASARRQERGRRLRRPRIVAVPVKNLNYGAEDIKFMESTFPYNCC